MNIVTEFRNFLKEYKIIGLAVAFILAQATTNMVQSLVDDMFMPLVTPFIPGGQWAEATWNIGPFVFSVGSFAGALLNFLLLAFIIFALSTFFFKRIHKKKKP